MTPLERTAAEIAKDKEAVARMSGAKSAMEGALARVKTLESAFRFIDAVNLETSKAFGPKMYIKVYRDAAWKTLPLSDQFDAIAKKIASVL